MLPGGLVASSGGKVVKNVAGYDLGKLFSGSRGRLGLIARVALRLHPRPAAEATVVAETDDPRTVWRELMRSQLEPSAVDLLPGKVAMLFEGPPQRGAQVPLPGELADASVWEESARLQAGPMARVPFEWQDCLIARPGPGHAYVAEAAPRPWSPLAERVRASFDPEGILS